MHRRSRLFAFTGLLSLLVAACSAPSPTSAAVLPIDDILTSAIVITPDPSGTSARLTVSSSIPLACAVIYGLDEDFGSIATDDDMDGGAHTDHAPVLRGLRPGTDYRYVVQGSDAAGNLYRSDVLTFTTPEATEPDRPGENVAPTGTVTDVSSEYSAGFAATNAIDGDPSTEWSTAGDGDDASLTIELPEVTEVVGFAIRSRSMGDGSSVIRTYQVTVDDGEVLGPFTAETDGLAVVEVATTGRRFRFEVLTSSGGNTGAVEIEILAAG
jgi:hypothetical protein